MITIEVRRRVASLALTGLLIGCSRPAQPDMPTPSDPFPEPTTVMMTDNRATVTIRPDGSHGTQLTIQDESQLVASIDPRLLPDLAAAVEDINAGAVPGRAEELGIAWLGLPCETQQRMTVRWQDSSPSIHVDRGPLDPAVCDDMGVIYGVVLRFLDEVDLSDVNVSISNRN